MEYSLLQTVLYLALPLLLLLLPILTRRRSRLPLPPGPKGLPIIGNMLMMDQLTHRGLAKLAQQWGGIFHMKMGNLHMVTVSSPEVARQVLQVQDNIFSNRPANIAISYLTYDRSDMAFAHYGPFWRQMRKISVMKLFSRKRAESWESVRDEVDSMVSTVAANAGKPMNVGELIFTLTMNITYRAAFGSKNEGQDEFIKILQEFSKLFGAFNIADFIPGLGWMDPQGLNSRLVKARGALDIFIDKIVDEHLEKRRLNQADDPNPDMVDDLLAFYDDQDANDNNNKATDNSADSLKLTKDNIKAIIMDVMFGGTETVASAIEWAMAELMKSPEDLRVVQQELAEVVGLDRRVEESDFEKLSFLKCTLKETLRLHPPIPLLLHETAEDAEVCGYSVPKRSRVMINAFAIGRDRNSWSEPDVFKPARFLKEGMPDFKGSNFEFLPFGSGRRSCPGMQLGLYALDLGVAHLLHCFKWELPDGMKPNDLDMSDVFGLTAPRATRLVAVPTPRLTCPL
ncbi:unnamed protein product [Linum trigynum]|uniref:Ferulate 5-hydroxylase n=1 Tax=Linum trigynum TaxID=586398 RepID=A0AAV2F9J9_9ROSI